MANFNGQFVKVERQRTPSYAAILVSGDEVRTEALPKILKDSHHTIIHVAVFSLNKSIGIFPTPSVIINDCAIDEHKMVIGV